MSVLSNLDIPQETVDAVGAKTSAGAMYGGSGVTVFAYYSLNDWALIVGIVVGVVGLAANLWFKWREDQRRAKFWDAKLADEAGE